jgi:hypothetical protein
MYGDEADLTLATSDGRVARRARHSNEYAAARSRRILLIHGFN